MPIVRLFQSTAAKLFAGRLRVCEICEAKRSGKRPPRGPFRTLARWPMKLEGQIYNIKVTSTHGGRKLGQEYRNVSGPTLDPVENWVARADSIPKYLDDAISTKPRRTTAAPVG